MVAYRLYCLNAADRFTRADWIEAEDDQRAVTALAAIRRGAVKCQLWQNSRMVVSFAEQDLD
jgi:hypothetical protein